MWINEINLINFRNYENKKIKLEKNINLFYGENAQGKTNIIESIFLSSIGKSFRTNNDKELIKFNEENSIILSNYNIEQIGSFIIAVKDRIEQVNKQQMEQLNYEKNPLSYILTPFVPEQEEISTEIKETKIKKPI